MLKYEKNKSNAAVHPLNKGNPDHFQLFRQNERPKPPCPY